MSSALSPRKDPSKLRWSKSKFPSSSDSKSPQPEKPSSTKLSLNLFFGFRSRKPSSPVSQDHPTPLASPASIIPDPDFNSIPFSRTPSKSISSTRSRVDSIGPKTPTDGLRESRQSLLTLSDLDPFAGRGITVVSSPQSAIGPNRLSIYSNGSLPDMGKPEHRLGSHSPMLLSSPTSRPLSPDSSQFSSPTSPRPDISFPSKSVLKKRSSDLSRKRPFTASDLSFGGAAEGALFKSDSSSTLTDKSRLASILPTRPVRPRGMTESAMIISNYSISVQTPSRSRQLSISRLGSPPCAPPTHELPPPPASSLPSHNDVPDTNDSFVSTEATSPTRSFLTRSPRKKVSDSSTKGSQKSPAGRCPKKAISCNSLVMDPTRSSGELSEPYLEDEKGKDLGERSPRKQRSFHHTRLPTLQMLSRSVGTLPMPSSPTGSQSPIMEERRGSNSSLPSRRRLFSGGSRRPSTSQSTSMEDDTQSIFSLRSEQSLSLSTSRPWTSSSSCPHSPFDDGVMEEPSSPSLASKYTPQRIMTPAEMAQVEASVEATSSRIRGLSVSTITSHREKDDDSTPATSPALSPFSNSDNSSTFPSRRSSLTYKGSNSPIRSSVRRSANPSPDTHEQSSYRPSSSPPLSLISLPPPPRPRQRTTTAPPSIRSCRTTSRQPADLQSLQPPPRKTLRTRASAEPLIRHHSVLRKPSFLEIDDDGVPDAYDRGELIPSPGDSFLDLTRESFGAGCR